MDPRTHAAFLGARAGDPRAFRALIEALGPDLVRFTTYLLEGDQDGAQDVVQDVFVAAWKQLARFESAEHLCRWCYRVGRFRTASWRRKQGSRGRRHVQLSTVPVEVRVTALHDGAGPPDAVRERASTFAALHVAVRRLPKRYGAPVQLHYLQGYNLHQTAHLLGVSHSSVKMRLVRARAHLRSTLADMLEPRAGAARAGRERPPVAQGGPHAR